MVVDDDFLDPVLEWLPLEEVSLLPVYDLEEEPLEYLWTGLLI